jgi:hypothetical protein
MFPITTACLKSKRRNTQRLSDQAYTGKIGELNPLLVTCPPLEEVIVGLVEDIIVIRND